jgi:transcriptional regulator of acetoin/glycerol metabolism
MQFERTGMAMTHPAEGAPGSGRKRERELTFGHSDTSVLLPPDPAHVEAIRQSHERCSAMGLSRIGSGDYSPLARADFGVSRERNHRLYVHAVPVMELLLEQIMATKSIVVLTDAEGTVLHSIGHEHFMERTSKIALAPGVNWCEASKGTNGMGTALITEEPIVVHADEHFMHAHDFLTCSAAPIFDPRGNVLGVLDVTGDHRSYHTHTMGLMKMSARMIENHWLTDDYRHALRLHFHSRYEFIDTLMEGILAVGHDGKFVGANRSALDLLGLSAAAVRMNSVTTLFGISLSAVVDHFRSSLGSPMCLTLGNGLQVHVRVRANWPVWRALGDLPARAAAGEPEQPLLLATGATLQAMPASPMPAQPEPTGLGSLQTGDPQMEAVIAKLRRALNRDISVLICGETGTGKEMLARAVHHDSARADRPFVTVNCASLPEALIEAELFGFEDGGLAGARRKGTGGKVVQAQGGTLFLDEIGDMPLKLQARLLHVLQDRRVASQGSASPAPVDVAIISASHRNLREMVERHEFREDLYYRLNGLSVRLPALRERGDLMAIVQKILRAECDGRLPELDAEVVRLLERYHWPGNVRQLCNVLRAAAIMAAGEPSITRSHLSDDFIEDAQRAMRQPLRAAGGDGGWLGAADAMPPAEAMASSAAGSAEQVTLEELELQTIQRVIKEVNGNVSLASKRLGISRNTIYRKLRRP